MSSLRGVPVLVTGGAGFIGSHLVDHLVERSCSVTVVDDLSSGLRENLPKDVRFIECDVSEVETYEGSLGEAAYVFHLAAHASVAESSQDPPADFQANAVSTVRLLEAIRNRNPETVFVYGSTVLVYGEQEKQPIREDAVQRPVSFYGLSKMMAERYVGMYAECFGIPAVIARYFNIYGPRQPRYVAHDVLQRLLDEEPAVLKMLGTGREARDFMYVQDAVEATLLLAESRPGYPCNVSTGISTTIGELVAILTDLTGNAGIPVEYSGSSWHGDLSICYGDNTRLRELGFAPKVGLRQGLEALVHWYEAGRPSRGPAVRLPA